MFQKDTLLEWRTVLDNVLIGAELLDLDMSVARRRAEELLRRYGLGEFLHSLPHQLSGGMRQRAALARTLVPRARHPAARRAVLGARLPDAACAVRRDGRHPGGEGKTVILVTHDIGEAVSMADRVVVMSRRPGRIKSEHRINFPSFGPPRPTPLEARKCAEFAGYFQTIWDELDIHRSNRRRGCHEQ